MINKSINCDKHPEVVCQQCLLDEIAVKEHELTELRSKLVSVKDTKTVSYQPSWTYTTMGGTNVAKTNPFSYASW